MDRRPNATAFADWGTKNPLTKKLLCSIAVPSLKNMIRKSRAAVGALCFLSGIWNHSAHAQQQGTDMETDLEVDPEIGVETDAESLSKYVWPEPLWPPPDQPGSELTDKGRDLRGIYLPTGVLLKNSVEEVVELVANKLRATAVIVDIKDDHGAITFSSALPLAKGRPHGLVRNMRTIVERFHEKNIYVIGRLVCFKDDVSTVRRPRTAVMDRITGKVWRNPTGNAWLDPYSVEAADLIVSVAKAAVELGFDEIQLDYVRFPVDPLTRHAHFPSRKPAIKRNEVMASLLYKIDQAIDRPLSADVFGLTAFNQGSAELLGQVIERLAPYLDALSPMLYLANFPQRYWENPDYRVSYNLTYGAVSRLRARLGGSIAIRPLLQGFRFRNAIYGIRYLEDQISAASSAGSSGHLFWNQLGKYEDVARAWSKVEAKASKPSAVASPASNP
jgi:hypothetical protein